MLKLFPFFNVSLLNLRSLCNQYNFNTEKKIFKQFEQKYFETTHIQGHKLKGQWFEIKTPNIYKNHFNLNKSTSNKKQTLLINIFMNINTHFERRTFFYLIDNDTYRGMD